MRYAGTWITKYFDDGIPYKIWEPSMPRIPDILLNCTIYLYPTKEAALDGKVAGGSGFMFAYYGKQMGQYPFFHMYAVTNSHIVRKAVGNSPVIRFNRLDNKIGIIELQEHHWHHHPDGDDIAVFPIDRLLFVNNPYNASKRGLSFVSHKMLLTTDDISALNIGPGDDVFTIGRFVNHEGKQRNLPSVRFGNIAQMPEEPILIDNGLKQEGFLVESRSISGYSGSPVFIYIPPYTDRWDGQGLSLQYHTRLLGINCAHLPFKERVIDRQKNPVEDYWVKGNSGMAIVIPAWKLEGVFSLKELVMARQKAEEEADAENESGAVLDTMIDDIEEPAIEFTKQEFEKALRKVSRPIQSPPDKGTSETSE